MHIVLVNNIYPPIAAGGAELIVAYLAEELVRRDHKVTVVSTCGPEMEPYPDEVRNGVRVIRYFPPNMYWSFARGKRPGWKSGLWHLRDAWNRKAGQRFAAILAAEPPDVVHTHLIDGFSAAVWRKARQAGAAVVHTAHDYHLLCPRAFLLTRDWKLCTNPSLGCRSYSRWHLATARLVDVFTSPSQFLIDRHLASGMKPRAVKLVHNGIEMPQVPARQASAEGEPLRILFAARMTVEKGVQVVLDAMRLLPADRRIELHIAGKGELQPLVEAAAAADPRIKFHGYVSGDQKHALFSKCDVLLLPSLWFENAPVVVVEAGAYGMGLIGSRIGAIPEFVRDGDTGLLFAPGDAQDLANTIAKVAADRSWLTRFASLGPSMAARFSVSRMASDYLSTYSSLLTHTVPRQAMV